jgi:ATP-dependent protease HslVU (ClpYQ) peptidase subunit
VTTIACNREMMVSDSKVTLENKGIEYPATKIIRGKGNWLIGAAGFAGDCSRFLKWAGSRFQDKEPKWDEEGGQEDSVIGIILKDDGIYVWTQGDPEPELTNTDFYAIGSGGKAARAAMILGVGPEKAVEVACEVDKMYSALPLQVLRLNAKGA